MQLDIGIVKRCMNTQGLSRQTEKQKDTQRHINITEIITYQQTWMPKMRTSEKNSLLTNRHNYHSIDAAITVDTLFILQIPC